MNATLGLFYLDETGLVSFPSFYSFGGDTLEAAGNLQVSYSGDGFPKVLVGTPVYQYLGRASGRLSYPSGAAIPQFSPEGLLTTFIISILAAAILTRIWKGGDAKKEYLSA